MKILETVKKEKKKIYVKSGIMVGMGERKLVTDKATFNLPSPRSGILVEVLSKEGKTVKVGEVLAVIEEEVK